MLVIEALAVLFLAYILCSLTLSKVPTDFDQFYKTVQTNPIFVETIMQTDFMFKQVHGILFEFFKSSIATSFLFLSFFLKLF